MKPAREPASSRPKPCASLKNAVLPRSLPVCGPPRKKNNRGQTSAFPSETSRFTPLILAHSPPRCYTWPVQTVQCVCVFFFSFHSFWTSSSLDVPAGVTQEEGHTGFLIRLLSALRALIFLARRIQPFEVEFCVLKI